METPFHTLGNLFMQLGLEHDPAAIEQFISTHKLQHDGRLADAPFWTPPQAAFISECLNEDSDWAEVVDHLDALLRG